MNTAGMSEDGPWTMFPLVPRRGPMYIACDSGFQRQAVAANLALPITGRPAAPLLTVYRNGPVLYCKSMSDIHRSVSGWVGNSAGHDIAEEHWYGSTTQLLRLLQSAPPQTAAAFVDLDAATDSSAPPGMFDLLEAAAEGLDFPVVILGSSVSQSTNPIDQIPRQFRRAQMLLTVTRIDQDDDGGMLRDTYLILIAKSELWTEFSGISLTLSAGTAADGTRVPWFSWGEPLKGSPSRLLKDARTGGFSPAVRNALRDATTLLTTPLTSTRLWNLLEQNHSQSVIGKALTQGEKRGMLAKNPMRNPDGSFMCWQWRAIAPPWPFPTSGTQAIPPLQPASTPGGMGGMDGLPNAGVFNAFPPSLLPNAQTGAGAGAGYRKPPTTEKPRFSNGWLLSYEIWDEFNRRFTETAAAENIHGELELAALKRDIARGYLAELKMSPILENDVTLLVNSYEQPAGP